MSQGNFYPINVRHFLIILVQRECSSLAKTQTKFEGSVSLQLGLLV